MFLHLFSSAWIAASLASALILLFVSVWLMIKKVSGNFREIEQRYEGLFDVSTEPLILIDQTTSEILRANPAAYHLYGYSNDEMLRLKPVDISAEPQETLKTMREYCVEIQRRLHKSKDGTVFPVAIAANYFTIKSRKVILASIRDIRTLVNSEEALAESEARFRATFEQAAVGIAHTSIDGKYLRINDKFCHILGYSREELLNTPFAAVTHPDDITASNSGLQKLLGGQITSASIEKRYIRKDGSVIWANITSSLMRNHSNQPMHFIAVVQDITDRKATQEALRASESMHRAMIANISDVIIIIGLDGLIGYISPNVEKGFGRKPEELVGTSCWDIVHPEDISWLMKKFEDLLKEEHGSSSVVYRIKHKNGDYRTLDVTAVNMMGDPDICGVLLNYRDITEKVSKEEEVRYISFHDSLTGLYNRTFFEQELKWLNAAGPLPYSIVMGGIDGLKLTNDVFGHEEGDRLLVEMAGILKNCCRPGDIIARTGGDEFNLLLPKADSSDVRTVCDRICQACEACEITTARGAYHPHISLGYAVKTDPRQTAEKILTDAEDFMYKRKLLERKSMHSSLIASIRATMNEKSHETKEHADRLITHSRAMGQKLHLSEEQLDELELLAELHDIGKISVDDRILASPNKLTEAEWLEMKKHPEVGYRIALASPELKQIANNILCHHEHWNGAGYPQMLKGEEIPLLARILAVADAYDAMTNDRVYRKAMLKEEALRELVRHSGEQFDPEIVKVFLGIA